jgi:hypothetical protein
LPTYLPPGGKGTILVDVFNVGAGASEGSITVTDTLPAGVKAIEAGGIVEGASVSTGLLPILGGEMWECTGNAAGESPRSVGKFQPATVVTCTNKTVPGPEGISLERFAGGAGPPSGDPSRFASNPNPQPRVGIIVEASHEVVTPAAAGVDPNRATIAGGGAPAPASTTDPVPVTSEEPRFGFVGWDGWFSNADGTLDTQAGSHPYEATFTFDLAEALKNIGPFVELRDAGSEPRDVEVRLPPGLVIDPLAVPQCTREQLAGERCPTASQVGFVAAYLSETEELGFRLFNMVPPPGTAGEVAFNFQGIVTRLDGGVRSGGDYGITAHADQIPQKDVAESVTTLWNVPEEASHDPWRDGEVGGCSPEDIRNGIEHCQAPEQPLTKPYLTLPTACSSLAPTVIRADTWRNAGETSQAEYKLHDSNGFEDQLTGCEHLGFAPPIFTAPDTARSDTPAGLTVEVKPSVGGLEEQGALGTSDIQNTTVALAPGLAINPGQAAGLQACGPAEDGLTTEAEKAKGEEDNGPAHCPNASKVGTVTIKSPLIEATEEKQFEGNVYVLQSNPPELKLLIAASADGVNLKLVGTAYLCESTGEAIAGKTCEAPGQLITTFDHTPELPSTLFKLSFSGGAQAALDTPAHCGVYTTNADFTPWSSPFIPDFLTSASFGLTEGPGGGACPSSPLPFAPTLVAGSTTDQAGGFTNFSLLLERGDGQQRIERLQFKAPAGLSGLISQVLLCTEPQAAAGTCSSASQIGHATVASGPGPYPLVIPQPGEPESPIYLTGPYGGAPFGLSIVTHVLAGPFNLGTIVTRARIEIDPHTAQITVTTDPLPQVVAGVPTDLRLINSVIDRAGFMFNPTNCTSQEFSGTAYGTPPPSEGGPHAQAAISSHFGVGSCRELGFSPDFKASTSGRTSKAKGASLDVKVLYPNTSPGHNQATSQANIASVKVELPKQLPSRLTTLQKACTAAQFDANPAGCPAASIVGHAVVHTPVLPVPLEGLAYFVSNGGEAFPNLIMVLQGYGVTVELVGDTFISKAGITSSTFKSTPDVPFSGFELNLPEGPFSALAANANLCAPTKTKTVRKRVTVRRRGRTVHLTRRVKQLVPESLLMPTTIVAQNGAEIHQDTKIGVEGCARHKAARKKAKGHKGKRGRRR